MRIITYSLIPNIEKCLSLVVGESRVSYEPRISVELKKLECCTTFWFGADKVVLCRLDYIVYVCIYI
jgi:hypothetical protein